MRSPSLIALVGAAAAVALGGALASGELDLPTVSRAGEPTSTAGPSPGDSTPSTSSASTSSGPGDSPGSTGTATVPAETADLPKPDGAESPDYRLPVAGCSVSYARSHHDYPAADMFADSGCRFVAPVAGVVDEVVRKDTWDPKTNRGADRGGRSVSLVGVDGVRYYGSHLAKVSPGITPGQEVAAGELLGRIGESGSARGTGSHLHFGISWPTPHGRWWVRRGTVPPQPYLDSWRDGGDRSPEPAVTKAQRRYGDDSRCKSYC